ncbi:haloacid dehalogenase [Exiguobacterium sp. Leaf187]|uniref:Haloacid dehalogenase n=1 Tax=Exiguobacterium indicum TaxID=296995 RepID=A0A0V8GI21_9BACL|nr:MULTISPECIES: haloacid dehalogenase type II [Exiguobacterium]AHA30935.1 haloacid dehalogenase [Exiguobacterium sp. MH3]KQS20201.1 haloacid dehalogenase [Exiguobacterium sp. Leaf187]KSU49791.1 haloacid dehalogenase [Exiguobacterium enclense]KTR25754.1 haloacid dehalogenase [Exiguobacterium indicum]MCQ4088990.1 haloacid dehalogenase type II [Exiguobacterium sp. LL15]
MTIQALVFDVYGTLFDVHSVKEQAEALYPDHGEAISKRWREKQLEYSFLRQLNGQYVPFSQVTQDALRYTLLELKLHVTEEQITTLMETYLTLDVYPEVSSVLETMADKRLVVFSNGSHDMLDPLIEQSGLADRFEHLVSVDDIKQYKPAPASYMHALNTLGLKREEILFMSSNGWDITGAKSFGFKTAWINRNGLPVEELNLDPDRIYDDLTGITEWQ